MSSPIRVGIIGLGPVTGSNLPGLWGSTAHLPFLMASPNYQVTAVCNSSVQSARTTIDAHHLGPGVKAYESAEDLADDPDVDMIVITVKVATHYALAKPALLAGKDVFVEWPLCATTAEAEELTKIAAEKGVKTIVGLQARAWPLLLKVKELVDSGRIGKVLSSTVVGTFVIIPTPVWAAGAEYYLDLNSGGNNFTIFFGHFLDSFVHVLGPFKKLTSIFKNDFHTTNIISIATGQIIYPNHPITTPSQVFVQGSLVSGAVSSLSYSTTGSGKTTDGNGIKWIINGTDGEIEVTCPEGQWQMDLPGAVLKARIGKGNEVEVVKLEVDEVKEVKEMTAPGTNTARLYQAFVEGKTEKYADFNEAVETHKLLDLIREASGNA